MIQILICMVRFTDNLDSFQKSLVGCRKKVCFERHGLIHIFALFSSTKSLQISFRFIYPIVWIDVIIG